MTFQILYLDYNPPLSHLGHSDSVENHEDFTDAEGKLWKIQCKTGWLEYDGDYIEFSTCSSYYHTRAGRTSHGKKSYQGQIDYFAVYSPDTKKVYLVPIGHVKSNSCNAEACAYEE